MSVTTQRPAYQFTQHRVDPICGDSILLILIMRALEVVCNHEVSHEPLVV